MSEKKHKYFTKSDASLFIHSIDSEQAKYTEQYGDFFSYNASNYTADTELALSQIIQNTYTLFLKLSTSQLLHFSNCQELGNYIPASLDWSLTLSHCMMVVYDICFQIIFAEDAGVNNLFDNLDNSDESIDLSCSHTYPNREFSSSIYKKMQTLIKHLEKANLTTWFQTKASCNNTQSTALLQSQLPLLRSILLSNDKNNDKFYFRKHMCIYDCDETKTSKRTTAMIKNADQQSSDHTFYLPCLHVIESGDYKNGIFFPGYSPFVKTLLPNSPLPRRIPYIKKQFSAFEYYCNYKLESIFNLHTGYQIFETYSNSEISLCNIHMENLCFIAGVSNILYRNSLLQSGLSSFTSWYASYCNQKKQIQENYKKEKLRQCTATENARLHSKHIIFSAKNSFDLYNMITHPNTSILYKKASARAYPCNPRTPNNKNSVRSISCFMTLTPECWLEKYTDFIMAYEQYVLALCERSIFYQLYSYFEKVEGGSKNLQKKQLYIYSMFKLADHYIKKDDNWKLPQNIEFKRKIYDYDYPDYIAEITPDFEISDYKTVPRVFRKLITASNSKGFPFSNFNQTLAEKIEKKLQTRYEPTEYCANIRIRRR